MANKQKWGNAKKMKKREWVEFLKSFGSEISKQGKDTYMLVFHFEKQQKLDDLTQLRIERAKVAAIETQIINAENSEITEQVGDLYTNKWYLSLIRGKNKNAR